jgi:phosphoglycolate phosphatase
MSLASRPKLILFDLDGTLVDSAPDLSWCADEMMLQLDMPVRGIESVRRWVGNGIERLVKRTLTNDMNAEPDEILFMHGLSLFEKLYTENSYQRSKPYPGVIEGLDELISSEFMLACVTNKAGVFTHRVLEGLNLAKYFELVVSGDTTKEKKPHPLPLLYAADYFDLGPSDCLMVGDSSNDVKAARAAGFAITCVSYGYNHGLDIRDAGADQVVDDIRLIDLGIV